MPLNPYIYGPSVSGDQFFGRDVELKQLASRIVQSAIPGSCSIVGETRIGKSSLLNKFVEWAKDQRSDLLFLRYDMSVSFQTGSTVDFYRQFISLVYSDLSHLPRIDHESALKAINPTTPWPVMVRSIEKLLLSVREAGYRLVIVFNEFDYITEHFRFEIQGWKLLLRLGNDRDYGVCYLIASRRSIAALEKDNSISSSFAGLFETVGLKLMPELEARSLVDIPVERLGLPWTEEQRNLALRVAGYHPYCLQMTCFHLFNWREQGGIAAVTNEVQLIELLKGHYRVFFDLLRIRLERTGLFDVLLKIAHGVPTGADIHQVEELVNLGYLVNVAGQHDKFRPFSPALDYYLNAYGRTMELWQLMEQAELALRNLIELRYRARFGDRWLDEIRLRNPGRAAQGNEPNVPGMVENWEHTREKERKNPFSVMDVNTSLIDFSFIGDLQQLINQQWPLFQDVFQGRPGDLKEHWKTLINARNPKAHYRRISDEGAARAELCCREILKAVRSHLP